MAEQDACWSRQRCRKERLGGGARESERELVRAAQGGGEVGHRAGAKGRVRAHAGFARVAPSTLRPRRFDRSTAGHTTPKTMHVPRCWSNAGQKPLRFRTVVPHALEKHKRPARCVRAWWVQPMGNRRAHALSPLPPTHDRPLRPLARPAQAYSPNSFGLKLGSPLSPRGFSHAGGLPRTRGGCGTSCRTLGMAGRVFLPPGMASRLTRARPGPPDTLG